MWATQCSITTIIVNTNIREINVWISDWPIDDNDVHAAMNDKLRLEWDEDLIKEKLSIQWKSLLMQIMMFYWWNNLFDITSDFQSCDESMINEWIQLLDYYLSIVSCQSFAHTSCSTKENISSKKCK